MPKITTIKLTRKYKIIALVFACLFATIGFLALRDSKAAVSADFNSDGTVNIIDLSILGTNYSKTGMAFNKGDANGDGTVNIIDLSILGSQWGTNPGADTTAPSVPTGLSATAVSSSQINLSWNASTDNVGVTQYIISRNGTQIATVNAPTTTYSNTGLSASTTYNYTVRARDAAGNTSANSAQVSGSTQGAMGPTGVSGNWTLAFQDEFNGSSLDTSRWKPYFNVYGDGNNEEACLTPSNVTVSSGSMKITAKREYVANCSPNNYGARDFTSGFIGSREQGHYYPAFAVYEIRAKLPHGQGLWPAFWLRHSDGSSRAEVDVMEYFHAQLPGKTSQTLHFPKEYQTNAYKVNKDFEAPTSNPGWHTWSVAIVPTNQAKTEAKFVFYTDGVKTGEYAPPSFDWLNNFNKNAMFDIAINLAVGGNWNGHPDDELGWSRYLSRCLNVYNRQSPCNPVGDVRRVNFPDVYEVDYVRVFTPQD